jgi:hypothetical protein
MFETSQKSTETGYTTTVALLVIAFIFSPAMLAILHPFGYATLLLALVGSVLCVTLAWFHWKRTSRLALPSMAMERVAEK